MQEKSQSDVGTEESVDVIEYSSEFHEGSHPVNPDRVTIHIAGFADSLAISYKGVCLHFDIGRIEDAHKLVKELVTSFTGARKSS